MMSHKRRGQDDRKNQGAGGKRSRWNKKHLYLVLDDWDKGSSVYKIDDDSFDDDSGSGSGSDDDDHPGVVARRLPEPPALRVESPDGRGAADTGMTFSALGTKIFVFMNRRCGLIYDTDTAVLAVGAHAPAKMICGLGISVPVGDVLYVLTYRYFDRDGHHSFEAMSWAPTAGTAAAAADAYRRLHRPAEGSWTWNTLPAPPPTFTTRQRVVSHALHPDGRTIFMTTGNKDTPGAPLGTYSFDTVEAAWRWHGECALPFLGKGHFDAELDAWVGLHRDGYVCSCQPVSPDFVSTRPLSRNTYSLLDPKVYLDCQTTKEKLFRKDVERDSMGATLTSMGSCRYCLVECLPSKKVGHDYDGSLIHMTMFGLKYNHKGELQPTDHRSTRSFKVSRYRDYFRPFAFWM